MAKMDEHTMVTIGVATVAVGMTAAVMTYWNRNSAPAPAADAFGESSGKAKKKKKKATKSDKSSAGAKPPEAEADSESSRVATPEPQAVAPSVPAPAVVGSPSPPAAPVAALPTEAPAAAPAAGEGAAKKKKKKKTKSGDLVASSEPEAEPEPEVVPEPALAAEPEVGSEGEEATGEGAKKKKKKNKKKKAAAQQETVPLPAGTVEGSSFAMDESETMDEDWTTITGKKSRPAKEKSGPSAEDMAAAAAKGEIVLDLGDHWPAVIGKGGEQIRAIQAETKAKVDVKRDTRQATVTGDAEAVQRAAEMITVIVSKAQAVADAKRTVTLDLADKLGAVLGKGGSTIRGISESTGARLDIDKDSNTITISGMPDEVGAAEKAVKLILVPPPPESTMRRELEGRMVNALLSNRGTAIREIQESTGAKLDLDRGEKNYLVIAGDAGQVMAANDRVSKILAEHSFFHTMELVPNDVGLLLGEKGETIRKIQQDSGASLDLERDGNTVTLRISGQQGAVDAAKDAVEKLLTGPPPMPKLAKGEVLEELELGDAVGSIIGAGGSNVKNLQESTGAKIDVLRGLSSCRVYGKPDPVNRAVEAIKKIINRQAELNEKRKKYEEGKAQQEAASQVVHMPDAEIVASWGPGGNWGGNVDDSELW